MSIVPLVKATVYGHQNDKAPVLTDLQEMGCMHVIPLQSVGDVRHDEGSYLQAREALKFLQSCPQKRRQVRDAVSFDEVVSIVNETLALQRRLQELEDERDFLHRRITDLRPWGDFTFPPLEERNFLRLWFYIVPHYQMKQVEATEHIWEVVGSDGRFSYVAVVSEEEPQDMPIPRTHTGNVPLSQLEKRLEDTEQEIENIHYERIRLTRWCSLLTRSLARMEDEATLTEAIRHTYDGSPVFVLQAWLPREDLDRLQAYAARKGLALEAEEATREETPPTLLRNPPKVASGQDLVSFYMTPSYWLADPSTIVFFSFIVFFGMIVGDVGYGLLLGFGVLMGWQPMGRSALGKRLRILFAALVGATVVWGALVGSFFGMTPGHLLAPLKLLDLNDYDTMMSVSILVGAGHVILANMMDIRRRGLSIGALAPAGWIAIMVGGLLVGFMGSPAGYWIMASGALAVILFTGEGSSVPRRLVQGLLGLTRISNAFGDVLSYLRLFALGLATSSLALAFNDLAMQVLNAVPGVGLLLALVILLIGHALNLALALVSGFVHGLRLNFIEFFNWSVPEEGVPFQAFSKKETVSWSQ